MSPDTQMKWFEAWFDSPYYHILYQNRDNEEAELFIDNLICFLEPGEKDTFLDMACGKGRHSVYLNKKGFPAIGIDLSQESIAYALQFENDTLHFYVQDMRKPFRINYFNYVLNLFTSFGYFEKEKDDLAVMQSAYKALKPDGVFVIDFMNVRKVINNLIQKEVKHVDGISFLIEKKVENHFIVKRIRFSDQGKNHDYYEKVKILTLNDFEKYLLAARLKIVNLFGDYNLSPFNEETSERLIIIAKKEGVTS